METNSVFICCLFEEEFWERTQQQELISGDCLSNGYTTWWARHCDCVHSVTVVFGGIGGFLTER
ncbi:hypothetical protein EPI10_029374 [Gossypium australe]|uniref:Uncharacterized protein n=1 Tax=Gossypium australe TaxID=47621 RepID=A0A5B6V1A7_9ROSI|nr:hypothetical protein EPI10_029374 [Gossypium australe]